MAVPYAVSVVSSLAEAPTNQLRVNNNFSREPKLGKLAVCVKPVHNYDQALELVEFLELYRILGVSSFNLYYHSAGPSVDCVLRHYVAHGVVTVLPWELELKSQVEIRTENIFSALNDCLYRNMYRYENVAMVDFDEFIMPRFNDTLVDLIDWLDSRNTLLHPGSYVFRNAFFYRQFPDDLATDHADPLASRLLTITKTRRKTELLPHYQRSKYICKPDHVVEVGNHFVWEHVKGARSVKVGQNVALSHHYRVCEFGGDLCVNATSMVDNVARKYKDRLLRNVRKIWSELRQSCDLPY